MSGALIFEREVQCVFEDAKNAEDVRHAVRDILFEISPRQETIAAGRTRISDLLLEEGSLCSSALLPIISEGADFDKDCGDLKDCATL